jgi:hypothetical protein
VDVIRFFTPQGKTTCNDDATTGFVTLEDG